MITTVTTHNVVTKPIEVDTSRINTTAWVILKPIDITTNKPKDIADKGKGKVMELLKDENKKLEQEHINKLKQLNSIMRRRENSLPREYRGDLVVT